MPCSFRPHGYQNLDPNVQIVSSALDDHPNVHLNVHIVSAVHTERDYNRSLSLSEILLK